MSSIRDSQMRGQSSSSFSHSAAPGWTYEAFISFTGVDTRNNFVSHLYDALIGAGIATFKDDMNLHKGKSIGPELIKAIEESRSAVVVFSKHYADSSWCLDELAKIIECEQKFGMKVFPVFYDVEPSEVRKQSGGYRLALIEHKIRFSSGELQKWREALTKAANDSGWDVAKTANGNESQCVKQIVRRILSIEGPYIADNLFGMEDHLRNLESMLATSSEDKDDVRIIGLWGPGGIGKTTIAQAIYGKMSYKFYGKCFVDGVRENGCDKNGLISLQNKILSKILMDKNIKVGSLQDGKREMSRRLRKKQVFLVLDDVDNAEHLEALVATPDWFCKGSTILITTRDKNVLPSFAQVYEPHQLYKSDAMRLFCVHAFQQKSPPKGYKELSDEVVCYTDGLPLALKVLGSFMKGIKDVEEWRSAIGSLGTEPQSKIHEVLKLSYDGLSYNQQQVFLDIACFFKGQNKELVTRILDSFGDGSDNQSVIAIRVLIRKSLLTVRNGDLCMHDLIQEMAWHTVRRSSTNEPKEPKEYSRLWHHNDIRDVLANDTDNTTIRGILLDTDQQVNITSRALERMKKLKYLDVREARISVQLTRLQKTVRWLNWNNNPVQLTHLPKTLRWFNWNNNPFISLPTGFQDLVGIQMLRSKVQILWDGEMELRKLKFIRLSGSSLQRFPNISGAPFVEMLILQDCCYLEEVHPTVGELKKLKFLNLRNCQGLRSLPPFTGMESLETLILSNSCNLKNFPMISGDMRKLSKIYMDEMTAIKVLDPTIGDLSGLRVLVFCSYGVVRLPSSIGELEHLRTLDLSSCFSLKELPDTIGCMKSLENLDLSSTSIKEFPRSFSSLKNLKSFSIGSDQSISKASQDFLLNCLSNFNSLRKLNLGGFKDLEGLLNHDISAWSSLEEIWIVDSNLVRLPYTVSQLPRLKMLVLRSCPRLRDLENLPRSIQVLYTEGCNSLTFITFLSLYEWLYKMSFKDCHGLLESTSTIRYINQLLSCRLQGPARQHQFSICVPGQVIPDWFMQRSFGTGAGTVSVSPEWHRDIIGFMISYISGESHWYIDEATMLFKITDVYGGTETVWSKTEPGESTHSVKPGKSADVTWIRYISFNFFKRIFHNVKPKDWSQVRGSLVICIPYSLLSAVRIVYKEDVKESMIGSEPDDLKFDYGNLEMIPGNGTRQSTDDLNEEPFKLSYNTAYVYEEEWDGMKLVKMDTDRKLLFHKK